MKLILSICVTLFLIIDVFGQNDTSSIFTKSNPERMIMSFENSIDYAHLEKEGLAVSSIEICDYPSLEKDSLPTHYSFPEYIPRVDSIVSVVQSNEILSVSFIVYNTSHLIIDWDTGVIVMDDGLMKIKCIPFGHAMAMSLIIP